MTDDRPTPSAPAHRPARSRALSAYDEAFARRAHRTLLVVFVLLVLLVPLLALLAGHAARQASHGGPTATPPTSSGVVFPVLAVMAIVTAAVIPLLRRRLLPAAARGPAGDTSIAPAPASPVLRGVAKYAVASLVSWGLCVAISGYGVALTLLTRKPLYAVAFAAGAIANLVVWAPRRRDLAAIWRAAARATSTGPDAPPPP